MSLPTANAPRVSIIVRCCNEERHLRKLLEGIQLQSVQDVETLLVDSGSTDGTLSIASSYPVKVLSIRPEEFSFGRSLNLGCRAARGDFLVAVSAHAYPVHRDWLEALLRPFEDEKVALVYGRQTGDHATRFSERRIFQRWFAETSDWNQGHSFCNNANAALRRRLWERYPYDEDLTGLEDLAWAKRVQAAGYRIAYEAAAVVFHIHSETPSRIYNRYRREAIAFHAIFEQERFDLADFGRMFVRNVLSDCYYARQERALTRHVADIVLFRFLQFWGTYRGFAQRGFVESALRKKFYYPDHIRGPRGSGANAREGRSAIDYSAVAERDS